MIFLMMVASPLYLSSVDDWRNRAYNRHVPDDSTHKVVKHFSNLLSNAYGISPIVDSIWAGVQDTSRRGYDLSMADPFHATLMEGITAITETYKAIDALRNSDIYETGLKKGDPIWTTNLWKAMDMGMTFAGKLTGIPYYNVRRLAGGVASNLLPGAEIKIDSIN